jgi:hypothetical protein
VLAPPAGLPSQGQARGANSARLMLGPDTSVATLIRETDTANLDWDTQRIWRAMVLAPTIEIFEALLADEPVPVTALDPLWAKRFGIR